MASCEYWKSIVTKLRNESECNWASHVLSTCVDEEGSNLSEALKCVSAEEIIENTIFAYQNSDAQPYCDEILFQFEKQKIIDVFEQMEKPNENNENMEKGF
jgi:hypothetical protein